MSYISRTLPEASSDNSFSALTDAILAIAPVSSTECTGDVSQYQEGVVLDLVAADTVGIEASSLQREVLPPVAVKCPPAGVEVIAVNLEYHALLGPQEVDREAVDLDLCSRFWQTALADETQKEPLGFRLGDRLASTSCDKPSKVRRSPTTIRPGKDIREIAPGGDLAHDQCLVQLPL
jgi:hypothetical protein